MKRMVVILCGLILCVQIGTAQTRHPVEGQLPAAKVKHAPKPKPGGGGVTLPFTVPLTASTWTTISTFQSFPLSNLADGSLSFVFPAGPTFAQAGSINYLHTRVNQDWNFSLGTQIVVNGQLFISPGVSLNHDTNPDNTCPPLPGPSTVRIMLWSNRQGNGEFDRWWANGTSYLMADGSFQILAPLVQDGSWGSVFGKSNIYDNASRAGWVKALQHVSNVALTFGGGCFAGHGVYATGPAQFTMQRFQVQ